MALLPLSFDRVPPFDEIAADRHATVGAELDLTMTGLRIEDWTET